MNIVSTVERLHICKAPQESTQLNQQTPHKSQLHDTPRLYLETLYTILIPQS